MNNLICWHDGEYKSLTEVSISPLDFGFIHSDATYDVMRAEHKKILFSDLHLNRFRDSCDYFGFAYNEDTLTIAQNLLDKNNLDSAFVWMINWRGIPPTGRPRDITAPQHELVYVKPYYSMSSNGLNLEINRQHYRVSDSSYNQKYKNFGWIEFNLAQRQAVEKGFDSAILLNSDHCVTEGPGFGICFVKDNSVYTPLTDCLGSVTIEVVESICNEFDIKFHRTNVFENDIKLFEECFVASTNGGITMVNSIENKKFTHTLSLFLKEHYDKKILL